MHARAIWQRMKCGRQVAIWAAVLLTACAGDGDRRPAAAEAVDRPAASGYVPSVASGPCTDWTTRACAVELSSHGGFVNCAPGVQVCEHGAWGPCAVDATRARVRVPAPPAAVGSGGLLGLQSIDGSSESCADNVCNPYCQIYEDEPDAPIEATRVDTPTGNLYGGSLQGSNVPTSFKSKGSLDAQCGAAEGSYEFNSACQFDQRCVDGECVALEPGESGTCEGIDVTTPTTCVPSSGGTRAITVCNRGTQTAPAGIKCYRYPGGSPQYPNDDPGVGTWVMTTANELEPGDCETQQVSEAVWGQNGIQSVACNPPESVDLTVTVGPQYPSLAGNTSGDLTWTSPDSAGAADSSSASATPPNPSGATTGPLSPTSSATFGSDLAWAQPENAYAASPAGSYATASPVAPSVASGAVGPSYPGANSTPASTGDASFTNPGRASAEDSSFATATPANPATTLTAAPSANNGSSSWSNLNLAYISGTPALYATATRSSAGTSDAELSGFGFDVPSGAVLDSLQLSVKWKTDLHHSRYTLSAQVQTGASNTAIGSALVKSGTYTTETTDTLTVPAATLAGFDASSFGNANLKVRLRFQRSNGSVATSTASVDSVQLTLVYHVPSTSASVVYRNFGLGAVPDDAAVQLTASVKWKASAVNSNVSLGLQVYSDYGLATQAAVGAELTRVASDTVEHVDTTGALTLTGAMLDDSSFAIRVRALRNYAAGSSPDVTASIDYVRVSLTWTTAGATTTHSILLRNFGFDNRIPGNATITSLTTAARWKLSALNTNVTLGLQAYKAQGTQAIGSEVTDATSPTSDTTAQQVVLSGVSVADLSDASFGVRVRVSRNGSSIANPDVTAMLDSVTVTAAWTAPSTTHGVTLGGFAFATLPANAVVHEIKTEVRWRSTTSTSKAVLGFQPYVGGTAIGSEYTDTAAPTTATTRTQTLSNLALGAADLSDGNFAVKLRVTRGSGGTNPDFTALVDFVRVTATYDVTQQVSVDECNGSNNWTATKLVPSPDACQDMSVPEYVPFTFTRVFQAVCPRGGSLWRNFEYNTSTPADTSIEFRFRSFPAAADGTCTALPAVSSGTPLPVATASLSADPQVCLLGSASSGCPVDLYAALGESGAMAECLQMDAHGTPASSASPELLDWNVLYDCPPNQ